MNRLAAFALAGSVILPASDSSTSWKAKAAEAQPPQEVSNAADTRFYRIADLEKTTRILDHYVRDSKYYRDVRGLGRGYDAKAVVGGETLYTRVPPLNFDAEESLLRFLKGHAGTQVYVSQTDSALTAVSVGECPARLTVPYTLGVSEIYSWVTESEKWKGLTGLGPAADSSSAPRRQPGAGSR